MSFKGLFFTLLLLSAFFQMSSCKKNPVIGSKILNVKGMKLKFNLVKESFKVETDIDPELKPFIDKFLELAKKNKQSIPSHVVSGLKKMIYVFEVNPSLGENAAAVCITQVSRQKNALGQKSLTWKEIHVKKSVVEKYGLNSKAFLAVIMHELFHCFKNREHYPRKEGLGIMNPELNLQDVNFLKNLDFYLSDMFDEAKIKLMPERPSAEEITTYNYGSVSKTILDASNFK